MRPLTEKEIRRVRRLFDRIKERDDLEASRQRLKYNAFWHAVGVIDEQPDTFVKPLDYNELGALW